MVRPRNPNRDKAYKLWLKSKERPLVDIAKELGERPSTVRKWKSQDNWERSDSKGSAPIKKERCVKANDPPQLVIDNNDLTEQQKLFCLYYLQHFNATKAYQQAYGCDYKTANVNGSRLLVNASIKAELHRLKAELQKDIFVDVKDVIAEYIKQAYSDIADYSEFGTEDHLLFDENGNPAIDEETGEQKVAKISYVRLKNSEEVDGTLIQEVKKGKDGVSVKLYDKQKAMSELLKFFTVDELKQAQIRKVQSEADIIENKASKLVLNEKEQSKVQGLIDIGQALIGPIDEDEESDTDE
ncbi:terminase small subunit [Enterococcus casseliflavus]|uniref:terminase small subunit n=1 Tax=Enterococcus TaxID=1350 RepID=UPI0012E15A8C|nr:terminase small subunit [Enterococcus casseliflavus]MUN75594.1 terminase [Enterococcus casseliflavus]MUN97965.1 terminase [Enterococcus casseliflavus]